MDNHHSVVTDVEWVVTTQTASWHNQTGLNAAAMEGHSDVTVQVEHPQQVIEGFGACFNELGWTSLAHLSQDDQDSILRELFAPGAGANFTLCRMPIGANDFSRNWYSYDEVPGDFALDQFTIENDFETLVPFIKGAMAYQPKLRLWASPWSPPTWMKTNGHYAAAIPSPWLPNVSNGLQPHQIGYEGADMFIREEHFLRAYAAYFGRFIDEYRKLGITIDMVMPQNEFNSAQVFPSCTWTPEGIAHFIRYLGPEMAERGVEVFIGTLERPDKRLIEVSLCDNEASRYITGVGLQWAGKGALTDVRRSHPHLRLYQTEQECGDGRNDWRFCRYTWSLIKRFLLGGAAAYLYWNISLLQGGTSRWGWSQNSLVTVDAATKTFVYNPEYYLIKHLSHFVRPGARLLRTESWNGWENQIAFANPDGTVVVVMQNDLGEDLPVRIRIGTRVISPILTADSFNTFVVPPEEGDLSEPS